MTSADAAATRPRQPRGESRLPPFPARRRSRRETCLRSTRIRAAHKGDTSTHTTHRRHRSEHSDDGSAIPSSSHPHRSQSIVARGRPAPRGRPPVPRENTTRYLAWRGTPQHRPTSGTHAAEDTAAALRTRQGENVRSVRVSVGCPFEQATRADSGEKERERGE